MRVTCGVVKIACFSASSVNVNETDRMQPLSNAKKLLDAQLKSLPIPYHTTGFYIGVLH
jgi:hypothetical protein